ncbi:hypothetical protein B0H11DRAFT_1932574 [Mycena galericulata]|nr:hypothetical protein B0H11DRAFT_1932574 [Mycena galericulata]
MPTSSDSPVELKSQRKPRVRIGVPHMSTGGKPPRPNLIDDEAEEASQDDDDEDEDEYESSFIDDVDVDKEVLIPWSRTPTPAPREATGRTASTHSQDEVVSSTSSRNKARQAKKIASTATLSEDNGSGRSKAKGIQSSAIEKPPGDPSSQTQLATRPSGSESMPAITPDLYECVVLNVARAVVTANYMSIQ